MSSIKPDSPIEYRGAEEIPTPESPNAPSTPDTQEKKVDQIAQERFRNVHFEEYDPKLDKPVAKKSILKKNIPTPEPLVAPDSGRDLSNLSIFRNFMKIKKPTYMDRLAFLEPVHKFAKELYATNNPNLDKFIDTALKLSEGGDVNNIRKELEALKNRNLNRMKDVQQKSTPTYTMEVVEALERIAYVGNATRPRSLETQEEIKAYIKDLRSGIIAEIEADGKDVERQADAMRAPTERGKVRNIPLHTDHMDNFIMGQMDPYTLANVEAYKKDLKIFLLPELEKMAQVPRAERSQFTDLESVNRYIEELMGKIKDLHS